jgi:hypothetical protein
MVHIHATQQRQSTLSRCCHPGRAWRLARAAGGETGPSAHIIIIIMIMIMYYGHTGGSQSDTLLSMGDPMVAPPTPDP